MHSLISSRSFIRSIVITFSLFAIISAKDGYLIISESQYLNDDNLQTFVDFRNQQYDVTLVSVSDAGSNVAGIKSYIKKAYTNDNLKYVLFVGQGKSSGGIPYETDGFPTYHNYGNMDNDNYLDVFVGCFFVRSAVDLENIINKTIFTENNISKYPKVQTQFSTFADDSHINNECTLMRDRYWESSSATYNYRTEWMIPAVGNGSQFVSNVEDEINNNKSTFIAYQGHGGETGWVGGMGNSVASSLTNDKVYPMIWSNACVTGSFQSSQKCFGEALTTAKGGASSFYGASNNSYVYQKMLNAGMACGVSMHKEIHTIGELFAYGKAFVRDSIHITNLSGFERVTGVDPEHEKMYNLFGDPALEFRETPAVTSISNLKNSSQIASINISSITRTSLNISVKELGNYSVSLFTVSGRLIKSISLINLAVGSNTVNWDGILVSNGVYFVSLSGMGLNAVSKVVFR